MTQVDTHWTQDAEYFEYTKAANPIGAGLISKVPLASFPGRLARTLSDAPADRLSPRHRGSGVAAGGLGQAAVDLGADLLGGDAGLRAAVDPDHALVGDHRGAAGDR